MTISRQLEQLPETQQAFANGELGYHHVSFMARTADHVGTAAVRQAEAKLLKAAGTMDPGRFTGVLKDFEHRVDAAGALAEANRAFERRYFHVSDPTDGLVRLDGLLDAEGGAIITTALNALIGPPARDDSRTAGQRRADALVELARKRTGGSGDGAGPRPHLVIRASLETLAGTPGAGAGALDWGGTVPGETVRRLACDAALTRITGKGELEGEISRATAPSRRRPGGRWPRATRAVSPRAAAGRRSGPTRITSSTGSRAARPRCRIWSCYAGAITGWSMKKAGSCAERLTNDGS